MEITVRLNKDFERFFQKMKEEYGDDFSDLNGLSDEKLSFSDFMDSFVDEETVADASVDGSSNVSNKDIVTLRSEMGKPHEKLLAYSKIFYEMKKMWGLREAKKWFELEWNKALYLHDANSSTFVPYCFAYDLTKLTEDGLFYLPDHHKPEPAKHLETFVDFIKEFINFTSNRTSGACGLPNLIPYMYYFWNEDIKSGHYPRCQDEETFAKSEIQRIIYGFNQPYTRDGIQSAFVNTSIFDGEYFDALFGGSEFPNGEFMIDHKEGIMKFQKWFLEEMDAIKDRGRMFTYPVNSISLLRQDGKFVDEDFAKWASNQNRKWNSSNFFVDNSVTSLSNCCRLKNDIKDLGYFNSIGGSQLRVGSVKVSTINMARIAYEAGGSEKKYLQILKDRLIIDMKLLHVIRHIIQRNVDKKLLPNFRDGIIDFKYLYNTIGINGIFETLKSFGYTTVDEFGNTFFTDDALRFGKEIFNVIHSTIDEFTADKDYMVNCEQIPGETAAVKFLYADKLLYRDEVIDDLPLYGNQWIPLGIKTTLQERVRICAIFDGYCNGGSILHANLDAPISDEENAWELLNHIADSGVTYFAFNGKLSACDNQHLFYGDICPECGEHKTAEWTRTVGFYTKTANWSKERKEEFKLREWHDVNNSETVKVD